MAVVASSQTNFAQPQGGVQVNWDHPLVIAGGIFAVLIPGIGILRKKGTEFFTPLNGGKINPAKIGTAFSATGGTSDGFSSVSNFDDVSGLAAASIYVEGDFPTASGTLLGRWSTTANFGGFLACWNPPELSLVIGADSNTANWNAINTSGASTGHIKFGYTWNGGSSAQPYLNGRTSTGSTWFSGSPSAIQTVGEKLYVCRHGDSASGSGDAKVNIAIIGNKAWNADIHAQIARNPFQILRAPDEHIAFDIPAAGTNVNPDVGTVAITGYAPSIAQPQTAAPGVGTVTITGYAPSVSQAANQSVSPGVGTVSITGYAPDVQIAAASQNITAGAGLISITGYAPQVTQGVIDTHDSLRKRKKSPSAAQRLDEREQQRESRRAELRKAIYGEESQAEEGKEAANFEELTAPSLDWKAFFDKQQEIAATWPPASIDDEDEDEELIMMMLQ